MYMVDFAQVLTDMERRGMRVNAKDYLAKVEVQAREEREYHVAVFRNWAAGILGADGLAMNPASAAQLSTFLFGGYPNQITKQPTEVERIFKTAIDELPLEAINAFEEREQRRLSKSLLSYDEKRNESVIDKMNLTQLKSICKGKGLKISGKKADLQERLRQYYSVPSSSSEDQIRLENNEYPMSSSEDQISLENNENTVSNHDEFDSMTDEDLRDAYGYEKIGKILERAAESDEQLAAVLRELDEKKNATVKYIDVKIKSIGMVPEKFTSGGSPSVTANVLRELAGDPFSDPPKYGKAYKFFKTHQEGYVTGDILLLLLLLLLKILLYFFYFLAHKHRHDACVGLYSLTAIGSIDTMIANFLSSLQSRVDEQSRVHCSLNFNTETGRLSSRGPNLQNQPALEKDKYKIRKAFESSPKNNLIVADYGQLELRLLASMTKCQSMIDAFKLGGDFHSRTAMNMFDYIQKKVDDGDILFEWDYSKGSPPKPLLKDVYASERRKAKTLNFSIAYGKTAHGLSQDWGVTPAEANHLLESWYSARPEVLKWQNEVKETARKKCYTRTLMGRYRNLPEAKSRNRKLSGQAQRASINTPIQGGAADIAMMAMIKLNNSEILKRLGWILLMQIHDEMVLEGPEETAEEAFEEVIKCMVSPWTFGLEETLVPLSVDGSFSSKDWYDAK